MFVGFAFITFADSESASAAVEGEVRQAAYFMLRGSMSLTYIDCVRRTARSCLGIESGFN